jgi:hypothetical protein
VSICNNGCVKNQENNVLIQLSASPVTIESIGSIYELLRVRLSPKLTSREGWHSSCYGDCGFEESIILCQFRKMIALDMGMDQNRNDTVGELSSGDF